MGTRSQTPMSQEDVMRTLFVAAIVAVAATFAPAPASAACDSICHAKCVADMKPENVPKCVSHWSAVNARGHKAAVREEAKFRQGR